MATHEACSILGHSLYIGDDVANYYHHKAHGIDSPENYKRVGPPNKE